MTQIKKIITARDYGTWPSFDLVYEWEDIMTVYLNAPLLHEKILNRNRLCSHLPPTFQDVSFVRTLLSCILSNKVVFLYEMGINDRKPQHNNPYIVPCIIDFFLKEKEELIEFYLKYSKNRVVLISSREVYDFLRSVNCPINIKHLPLSISDRYKIHSSTHYEKCYDVALMGRQNPVLEQYVKQYALTHPNFVYVYRILKDGAFNYYTSDGKTVGNIRTREQYMNLMRRSRVGLYSTPGIDGGESRTNGFNQVTPRFLELIACGCHIIARYEKNSDTEYYEIDNFSPSVSSYEEFEGLMDDALKKDVDMEVYSNYLSKHYTSVRCEKLKQIIENI